MCWSRSREKPEFASGIADTLEAAKAALFKTRAPSYPPNEACRENGSVLCRCNRISLRRQLNVGLTITLPPRESGGCQLDSGRDRNANAGHRRSGAVVRAQSADDQLLGRRG